MLYTLCTVALVVTKSEILWNCSKEVVSGKPGCSDFGRVQGRRQQVAARAASGAQQRKRARAQLLAHTGPFVVVAQRLVQFTCKQLKLSFFKFKLLKKYLM